MWWNNQQKLRIFLYILLFIAATFAVIYVSYWVEEGTVARKPVVQPADGSLPPPPTDKK